MPGLLTDVHLGAVAFVRNHAWTPEAVSYGVESETHGVIADNRETVACTLRVEFKWHRRDDGEPVEGPFALTVAVVGTFAWTQPDDTDEDILGWAEFNSQHLLWPYVRSYVSTITSASGLPNLTLFTLSVPSPASGVPGEDPLAASPVPPELR